MNQPRSAMPAWTAAMSWRSEVTTITLKQGSPSGWKPGHPRIAARNASRASLSLRRARDSLARRDGAPPPRAEAKGAPGAVPASVGVTIGGSG
ncbi:MAG: hypothetical protein WDN24_06460 [Sphingomonas sp.]